MSLKTDRHWVMLRMIPRAPSRIGVGEIAERLRAVGMATTTRSIQRDLNDLSAKFPLIGDAARPQGWSWAKDAPQQSFPTYDEQARIALALAHEQLESVLPRETFRRLAPVFSEIGETGNAARGKGTRLSDLVQVRSRRQALIPPTVKPSVHEAVCRAVVCGRQLEIRYESRSSRRTVSMTVHPLGLIVSEGTCYLVATIGSYEDIRHLAMHRIHHAARIDLPARRPARFSLQTHLDQGGMELRQSSALLALRFRIRNLWATHLEESMLSRDQTVQPAGDGWTVVIATVPDTMQIRWWLRGYGADLEVLEPQSLRAEFVELARKSNELYGHRDSSGLNG
jgi:predicted DNA-binding transcriptional regulator YafY